MSETVEQLREFLRVAALLRRYAAQSERRSDIEVFIAAADALESHAARLAYGEDAIMAPAPETHINLVC